MADPKPEDLIDKDRGLRAEVLLSNELLREAFDTLESTYIEAWKSNGASMTPQDARMPTRLDAAGRDRLWQAYQVIGKVRAHLEQIVRDGETAAAFIASDLQKQD